MAAEAAGNQVGESRDTEIIRFMSHSHLILCSFKNIKCIFKNTFLAAVLWGVSSLTHILLVMFLISICKLFRSIRDDVEL